MVGHFRKNRIGNWKMISAHFFFKFIMALSFLSFTKAFVRIFFTKRPENKCDNQKGIVEIIFLEKKLRSKRCVPLQLY